MKNTVLASVYVDMTPLMGMMQCCLDYLAQTSEFLWVLVTGITENTDLLLQPTHMVQMKHRAWHLCLHVGPVLLMSWFSNHPLSSVCRHAHYFARLSHWTLTWDQQDLLSLSFLSLSPVFGFFFFFNSSSVVLQSHCQAMVPILEDEASCPIPNFSSPPEISESIAPFSKEATWSLLVRAGFLGF